MVGGYPQFDDCVHARALVSCALDGEVSELAQAQLERHLAACAECRAFADSVGATAALLRSAPLEQPARRFVAPPRVVRFPVGRRVAVAAVAAAAALGSLIGSSLRAPAPPEQPAPQLSFLSRDVEQLRDLPRQRQLQRQPTPRTNPQEGIV
jgi:hypothetical protein